MPLGVFLSNGSYTECGQLWLSVFCSTSQHGREFFVLAQEFLMYKGRPLVRSGDTLYYGSMGDKCVAHLQIKSQAPAHGINTATKVSVQLIATDESLPLKERMLNKAERDGLYEALSIASIWLDRHNK